MKSFEKIGYGVLLILAIVILTNTLRNCRQPKTSPKPAISAEETVAPEGGKYPLPPEVESRVEPTNNPPAP